MADLDTGEVHEERMRQAAQVLAASFDRWRRVVQISDTMLFQAADLCAVAVTPRTGMNMWGRPARGNAATDRMMAEQGIGDGVHLFAVARGTPAWRAGLRDGDEILAFDSWPVPRRRDGYVEARDRMGQLVQERRPIRVTYRRAGRIATAQVAPQLACGYGVSVANSDTINAFANGRAVLVTRGLVDYLQSDDELALVIGHEIAHNLRGHLAQVRAARQAGVLDTGYTQAFEREADYVGLYLVARAGFDYRRAPDSVRRLALRSPNAIFYARTHPTTPERVVALQAAVREIDAKRARRQALVPGL
jgi:Zn-dependent protease with chaperone function